jgi:hypothetical protein
MQLPEFIRDLFNPQNPSLMVLLIAVITIAVVVIILRRRKKRQNEPPILRHVSKMLSNIQKGKDLHPPVVMTRQDIITNMFSSKMTAIGITPSTDSGYLPTSQTPLARYLRKYGVPDDIIDAIMAGLAEETTAQSVRDIIDAAADTPTITLEGVYLERAKDLAVEEWDKKRRSNSFQV